MSDPMKEHHSLPVAFAWSIVLMSAALVVACFLQNCGAMR